MQSLIQLLPSGAAFFIGVVLIVMMTGRLVHHKGSLARAALPFVVPLRWGWPRVERAMERGHVVLDTLFDHAFTWCLSNLPVVPVRLGSAERELRALDTSTIARLRAGARLALAGKGFYHRADRTVRANIVAAATSIVMIRGARCEEAVDMLWRDLPPSERKRLIIVDAGIATHEHFAATTEQDALLGRLRINSTLRCAPSSPKGRRGHPTCHGPLLHPGAPTPEVAPDDERLVSGKKGDVRIRRWNALHDVEARYTLLDVLRLDDPASPRPLGVGTMARELTTDELLADLSPAVAGGNQFLCRPGYHRAGDAQSMDGKSVGETPQFVAVDRDAVASHRGGVSTIRDGTMGSEANAFRRALGQLFGYPRRQFLGLCPQRGCTQKLPSKSRA